MWREWGWIKYIYIGLIVCLANQNAISQTGINPMYSFPLEELSAENDSICSFPILSPTGQKSILFDPRDESIRFKFPGYDNVIPYQSAAYLVIDVEHANPASLVILLEFMRKGDQADQSGWMNSRVSARMGVLPFIQTRLIFPLSYLDAQKIFLPKMPRQLKGTIDGKRMDAKDIGNFYIRLKNTKPKTFPQQVYIQGVFLFDELPPPLPQVEFPLVDSLGQWTKKDWKGKIHSFDELAKEINSLERSLITEELPEGRSAFMGFSNLQFDSTGFFHTHNDGQRWWLVDPSGFAYLSIAPTGVRAFSHGPVEKNEDLFEWLPPETGTFEKAYAIQSGLKSLSFVTLNLIRLWGDAFLSRWLAYTGNLIKYMGFTSSGNWSDPLFHREGGLPYFYPMSGFPSTKIKLFRDFPDVFDPEYEISALLYARQLETRKEDPLMIGYFLGNEPHWAFGEFNLAREMMYTSEQSYSRKEFIHWLSEKYEHNPFLLSAAWGFEFNNFGDLNYFIFPKEKDISEKAETDLMEFSSMMVDKYAKTICDATQTVDQNHLNLGLRFAWVSSKACLQAGKYFDVFSLNGYTFPDPPETQLILDELKKPVLIGEFHFGSIDRGLPATGLKGVKTQIARGNAYRHYVENGFARPEIIAIHYFQWNDQPVTGRFDGENYNIGIVDVTYRPYTDLAKRIRKTNNRIFEVATGQKSPYSRIPAAIPAIYY